MVKSQNQNVQIWNPIVDTFMIFTSRYVWASLSVMKTHRWKQLILVCFDSASHWKKVINVTQTISVAAIIKYDMEALWEFETFVEEQATGN